MEIFLSLRWAALDHEKFDFVYLIIVVASPLVNNGKVLKIPNNDASIMRGRGHVPIALANLNVDNHVSVPVQRCLQNHVLLVPNLDDPVVGSSDDHLVLEVKLTVVNWGSSAFGEVGVSEDCFHAFESLSISVKQFVANLA